jgi:hypothetical protein
VKRKTPKKRKHVLGIDENAFSPSSILRFRFLKIMFLAVGRNAVNSDPKRSQLRPKTPMLLVLNDDGFDRYSLADMIENP